MVSGKFHIGLLLFLWLGLNSAVSLAASLHIEVEQHRLELGQPIWLTLRSDQTAVSLATLDFSAWKKRVAFPRAYYVNRNRDNTAQTLRLRVYAYHTGNLVLPALQFMQHTTAPLHFTIVPARDPVTHAPMDFGCQVSTQQPWQQQQVVVGCRLRLHDAHALLTQPTAQQHGFRFYPMQVEKRVEGRGATAQTRYRLGWVVFAVRAGKQVLTLPPIEYVRDGVVTRRFYLDPQQLQLQVKALPSWLPGTIPVGQIGPVHYGLAYGWLSTGVLSQMQLRVQLNGVAPSLVPDYPALLHGSHVFMFYRARQRNQARVESTGIQYLLDDRIPLVAHHVGIYRLPDLRLQYFDPVRGTLQTRLLHGGTIVVVNSWIKLILGLLCVVALVWLGHRVGRFLVRYWRRFRHYQQALAILERPVSLDSIRHGMRVMAMAEGGRANMSWLQWQDYMRDKSALAESLPVTQLNAAVYGHGSVDLERCVDHLCSLCRQRRRAIS